MQPFASSIWKCNAGCGAAVARPAMLCNKCKSKVGASHHLYYRQPRRELLPTAGQIIEAVAELFNVPVNYISGDGPPLDAAPAFFIPRRSARWLLQRLLKLTRAEIMQLTGSLAGRTSNVVSHSIDYVEKHPKVKLKLEQLCEERGWILPDSADAELKRQQLLLSIKNAVAIYFGCPFHATEAAKQGRGVQNDPLHVTRWLAFRTLRMLETELASLLKVSRANIHYSLKTVDNEPRLLSRALAIARANRWTLYRHSSTQFHAGEYSWVPYSEEDAPTLPPPPVRVTLSDLHPTVLETLTAVAIELGIEPERLVGFMCGCRDKTIIDAVSLVCYICFCRGVRLIDISRSIGGQTLGKAEGYIKKVRQRPDLIQRSTEFAQHRGWTMERERGKVKNTVY